MISETVDHQYNQRCDFSFAGGVQARTERQYVARLKDEQHLQYLEHPWLLKLASSQMHTRSRNTAKVSVSDCHDIWGSDANRRAVFRE